MSPITSHPYLSEDQQKELNDIAKALSRPGAGILAADETPKAMEARFASLKIENTPEVTFKYGQKETNNLSIAILTRLGDSTDSFCLVVPRTV